MCKAKFTCPPPTRHELMASFTGPELGTLVSPNPNPEPNPNPDPDPNPEPNLGALVSEGCVIGAHEVFTEELERQMASMPPFTQAASSYAHWCGGCYLITTISQAG